MDAILENPAQMLDHYSRGNTLVKLKEKEKFQYKEEMISSKLRSLRSCVPPRSNRKWSNDNNWGTDSPPLLSNRLYMSSCILICKSLYLGGVLEVRSLMKPLFNAWETVSVP
jgi:hypothetical protein